jgi:zinc protease
VLPPIHKRITRPGEQATLLMGFRACPARHEDQFAVRVLNGVLGESMSSRFFLKLRDARGLAYAIGSSYSPMKEAGHIVGYIGTQPARLDEARDQMLQEFELLRHELVPEDELERAKRYIVGRFLIDHQRNVSRANYLGHFEFSGYGWQMDAEYPNFIEAITAQDVRTVAEKYLQNPTILEVAP